MNKNKLYIFLLIAFGAGTLVGYFSAQPLQNNHEAQPQLSQGDQIRALENQLSDANKKISALQLGARPSPTVASPNPATPDAAATTANAQRTAENDKLSALEGQLITQKLKEKHQWLLDGYAKSRNFDPGETMQKKFDEEPVDFTWAEEQENNLISTFSSNPELAGFALLDTKCKSSLCQVSVSFTDAEQANKIATQVSQTISSLDKYTSVVASPNAQTKITTLYVALADK